MVAAVVMTPPLMRTAASWRSPWRIGYEHQCPMLQRLGLGLRAERPGCQAEPARRLDDRLVCLDVPRQSVAISRLANLDAEGDKPPAA